MSLIIYQTCVNDAGHAAVDNLTCSALAGVCIIEQEQPAQAGRGFEMAGSRVYNVKPQPPAGSLCNDQSGRRPFKSSQFWYLRGSWLPGKRF